MSRTCLRVNPHFIVAGMSRNSLLEAEIWSLSDFNWTQTHNHLVCKRTFNHLAFTQRYIVRDFLVLLSVFVKKVTVSENISFIDYAFRNRLPDCSKLTINRKNDNDVTICRHGIIVKFFRSCFVSFVKFGLSFISIS